MVKQLAFQGFNFSVFRQENYVFACEHVEKDSLCYFIADEKKRTARLCFSDTPPVFLDGSEEEREKNDQRYKRLKEKSILCRKMEEQDKSFFKDLYCAMSETLSNVE